jgi:hypothetical protein
MKPRTKKKPKSKGQRKQKQSIKLKSASKSVKVSGRGNNSNSDSVKEEPNAAVIEYLKYYPFNNKSDVDKFYERVDREWGDFKGGTNLLDVDVKESKKVNSINDVLKAMRKAKKTTFCNRKNGNGDCEDTADEVLELLKHDAKGKYVVESHRIVYYIEEHDEDGNDYGETPEFVQNHGFLVIYPLSSKNKKWFKYGRMKINRPKSVSNKSSSSRSSSRERSVNRTN